MKLQTAKHSEQFMQYFTPELFVRFNSTDEDVANEADEAWETAVLEYRKHLDSIRDGMTSQVRKLTDLCLHDAELLAFDQNVEPTFSAPFEPLGSFPLWSAMAILSVKQDSKIVTLMYLLWDRVRERSSQPDWPFSKRRTHWLYDEIDTVDNHPGAFVHRILLSDGRVLEIPFVSVITHGIPLTPTTENELSMQSV